MLLNIITNIIFYIYYVILYSDGNKEVIDVYCNAADQLLHTRQWINAETDDSHSDGIKIVNG